MSMPPDHYAITFKIQKNPHTKHLVLISYCRTMTMIELLIYWKIQKNFKGSSKRNFCQGGNTCSTSTKEEQHF